MKHYYLIPLLCLLALGGHAQVAPFGLTVISQETPADNDLSFQVLAVAHSTGPATYHVRLESPTFTLTNSLTAPAVQQVAAGDTLRTTVTVSYDPDRVPFTLEKLQVELLDPADNVLASVPAFVYFTPYKTVELWNRYDLDELKRVWDAADPESQPQRVYVDPHSIPLSDLTDEELADPDLRYKFRSIPGLAYAIPMRDTGQDADEDDGDDPNGGGQALLFGRHTWDATITGRVLTEQWNGQSKNVRSALDLKVTGIQVEVWDKDGLWDDKLATDYTDDNGDFSIHFRETQGSEGSYLELYLNIVASTTGGTIRVIRRIGWTREGTAYLGNPINLHYNTRALSFGSVRPNHDDVKPHLLHYGKQSRNFVTSNVSGVLPNSPYLPLNIMITPLNRAQNTAFFLPGGFRNAAGGIPGTVASFYLSNNDCLYIGENEETEETAYHEFGHYAMWHMQNRSWANPLEASFASHLYVTNADNPKIAWTEGWANGFAMIMDAATERYDGERNFNESIDFGNEIRTTLESNRYSVRRNGAVASEFTLTKGFLSEYFIGTTLFDLWDGSGTTTPTSAVFNDNNPGNAFRPGRPSPSPVGNILDEAALSFAVLTAPIRNHAGNGSWGIGQFSSAVVQNITDYYRYLQQLNGDCDEHRRLSNAFLINRISDFPTQAGLPPDAPIQRLGTDEIQRNVSFSEPKFTSNNGAYEPSGVTQFSLTLDKNELAGAADSYNLAAATATGAGSLSDPLTVRDGAALGLNAGTERGYPGSGQYAPGGSRLDADLCGQMRLTLARDGRLDVGSPQGYTAAAALGSGGLIEAQNGGLIQVRAGSVLTIRRGATLLVRNGSTLTVDGQVRVESGGFLCVETGANLAFSPASELYIDAAATLGTNPALNLTTTACTGQLPVCGQLTGGNAGVTATGGRNEALAFDGGDIVTIANTNSTVNNSMHGPFAIEAFVRADNLNRTGAQTIFSSRHRVGAFGLDGILFSLYNGGQLLLQLGGANYYDAAAQLPNDLGCHHVAVTRDGQNRVRFYIDGQESAYTPQLGTSGNTTGNLNIGADQAGDNPAEFFQGTVGEVRVWNSWRSATQIRQGLTARLVPGQQGGLVAYYDMQDAAGSATLSDLSGVSPAVPGALGTPAGGGTDVPTWVTQCQLSCTVQGNFRSSGPAAAWSPADSLNDTNLRRAYGRGQGKLALSVSPNPATATGEVATLHFETRQAGPVRVWVQDLLGAERTVLLPATELAAGPQNLPLPLTTLPPGLYLVLVQSGTHREHIRLQVNP